MYDVNRNGYWFSKEQLEEHDKQIRADAIDEVIERIKQITRKDIIVIDKANLDDISEQLKAGGKNE